VLNWVKDRANIKSRNAVKRMARGNQRQCRKDGFTKATTTVKTDGDDNVEREASFRRRLVKAGGLGEDITHLRGGVASTEDPCVAAAQRAAKEAHDPVPVDCSKKPWGVGFYRKAGVAKDPKKKTISSRGEGVCVKCTKCNKGMYRVGCGEKDIQRAPSSLGRRLGETIFRVKGGKAAQVDMPGESAEGKCTKCENCPPGKVRVNCGNVLPNEGKAVVSPGECVKCEKLCYKGEYHEFCAGKPGTGTGGNDGKRRRRGAQTHHLKAGATSSLSQNTHWIPDTYSKGPVRVTPPRTWVPAACCPCCVRLRYDGRLWQADHVRFQARAREGPRGVQALRGSRRRQRRRRPGGRQHPNVDSKCWTC
jgi:hypothetical protein